MAYRKVTHLLLSPFFAMFVNSVAHSGDEGLTAADVIAAIEMSDLLKDKSYGRVEFHVLDEAGQTAYIEPILPKDAQSNAIVLFSVSNILPAGQRCRNISGPDETRMGASLWLDWCEPGSVNRLQSDIFQLKFNGTKGAYIVSFRDIHCVNEADDIPDDIEATFC